jgi:hypothetical protein
MRIKNLSLNFMYNLPTISTWYISLFDGIDSHMRHRVGTNTNEDTLTNKNKIKNKYVKIMLIDLTILFFYCKKKNFCVCILFGFVPMQSLLMRHGVH